VIHHLADDEQTIAIRRFAHEAEAFFAQTLKTVGRAARFERSAADDLCASLGDDFRDPLNLISRFHTARTGHDHHALGADLDILDPDYGAAGAEAAADQLIWRRDAMRVFDALHDLEVGRVEVARAHAAKYGMKHACRPVHVEAEVDEPVD